MWHNVLQNSDIPCECCGKTWMELRAGKVTGSVIGKIMANYGKAFGEPAKAVAVGIAKIELGGTPTLDNYSNGHMERGTEEEPLIRALYEEDFFTEVSNGGFLDNGKTGISTDGWIDRTGIIEIKSHIDSLHYNCIKRGSYDSAYKWQVIFNLKEALKEYPIEFIDFISGCLSFPPGKKIYVVRVRPEEVQPEFTMIDTRLDEFFNLVKEVKNDIIKAY